MSNDVPSVPEAFRLHIRGLRGFTAGESADVAVDLWTWLHTHGYLRRECECDRLLRQAEEEDDV